MSDPRVISVDIESYGISDTDAKGNPLPPQTVFHPARAVWTDGCHPSTLNLTCAITIPKEDPRCINSMNCDPSTKGGGMSITNSDTSITLLMKEHGISFAGWDAKKIASLCPGPTMLLEMWKPIHRKILAAWLNHADTLIGMNLLFDVLFLRVYPELRPLLAGRHTIIDVSFLNFLHCEVRKEVSLKTIGPVLSQYAYDPEELQLKQGRRYPNPHDPRLHHYNGEDTHNSILAVSELARRIQIEYPPELFTCLLPPLPKNEPNSEQQKSKISSPRSLISASPTTCPSASEITTSSSPTSTNSGQDSSTLLPTTPLQKLNPWSIEWLKESFWSCVRMSEAGIPADRNSLQRFERSLLLKAEIAADLALTNHNLILVGEGSEKSKEEFLSACIKDIDEAAPLGTRSLYDHPLFELTDKTKRIRVNDLNRLLIKHGLPSAHPAHDALRLWDIQAGSQKLVSSYTYPLLHHRRTKPEDKKSVLVPNSPVTWNSSSSSSSTQPSAAPSTTESLNASVTSSVRWRRRTPKQYAERHKRKHLKKLPPSNKKSRAAHVKDSTPTIPTKHFYDHGRPHRTPSSFDLRPNVQIAYPSWYIIPSPYKDSGEEHGGQKQGRLSCKNPAAQTWPASIKKHVRSRFPAGVVYTFDLSQAELRVAALLSGEPSLLQAYKDNLDLHSERAIAVFGKEIQSHPDFKTVYRQAAKHANFSDLNLASAPTLQCTILEKSSKVDRVGVFIPLEICETIVNTRPQVRPLLYRWQMELIENAKSLGCQVLPFTGISRYCLGGEKNEDSEIVNFPVQHTAAVAMRCVQHYIDKKLPPLAIPIYNHHSLSFQNTYDAAYYDCKTYQHALDLQELTAEAVEYVTTKGYWAMMQDLYGREVPLQYDPHIYKGK